MNSTGDPWLHRLVAALVRHRLFLLCGAMLLFGVAAWTAYDIQTDPFRLVRRLQFDQSIEALYAEDDPYLREYLRSKRLFGGDEFVIVAYRDPLLFEPEAWQLTAAADARIRALADALSGVPGVMSESTQNLAEALFPEDLHPAIRRLVRARDEELRALAEGVMMGEDRETTAIVLRLLPEAETLATRAETIFDIRDRAIRFAGKHELPEAGGFSVFVVGEPVQIHDLFRYVEDDGETLFWWSLLLLAAVLVVLFRSLRWVALPLVIVVVTIVWTQAILVASGLRLSMVSSMLNSLVTIISIATVTHVTVHFRDLRGTMDRFDALRQTLIDLLPAIFWTIVTTAVGFAALLTSHITPVHSFGLMMSLATLLVLVAVVMILPAGILLGGFSTDPRATPGEAPLLRSLDRITRTVAGYPRAVGVGVLMVFLVAALGFLLLEVETDFSENFRADSDIVQSLDFVETRLGGAGNWEVNFPAPRELTPQFLVQIRSLAAKLRALEVNGRQGVSKVLAVTDGLDMVPEVPLFMTSIEQRLGALSWIQPEFVASLYNRSQQRMRIVLRARERQQADTKLSLIAQAQDLARLEFPTAQFPNEPPAQATGLFVLLAHLIDSLMADQWTSFAFAAAGIVTTMTIAFRSLKIGLLSLLPNVFPIVLVIGGMGWVHASGLFDARINIATAMIASVSMGLTVDSSIHYIAGFRRARARGMSVQQSLHETQQGVGRALVFANFALIVGFSVLTLSHFIPLIYFGILVGAAMLGGLAGNLVLLPLLLPWATREPS